MKLIPTILLVSLALLSPVVAQADDNPELISGSGCSAIGGLGAMAVYNAHIALGRIAEADTSTPESLKRAAQDAGGIKGGTGAIIKIYGECKPNVPKAEQASIEMLLKMSQLVEQQASALINLLKTRHEKGDIATAQKELAEIRAKCAKMIATNLGFDEALVK